MSTPLRSTTTMAKLDAGTKPKQPSLRRDAAVPPVTLLTLNASAYHASIAVDDDNVVYVLTAQAAYRIVDEKKPQVFSLPLGFGAALTQSSILYWSNGAVWRASKFDGKARRICTTKRQPQYFVASRDYFAWLERSEEGKFTIQTSEQGKPHVIYAPDGMIDAMTMIDHWVFFVERIANGSWRIGSIRLDASSPAFTAARTGRSPAMLTAGHDIVYYDGNTLEIRQLSPDLQHESTVVRGQICSPIAATDTIFCAQMGGLYEVSPSNPTPTTLVEGSQASVTNIAANASFIVWLSDVGEERLAVNLLRRSATKAER